METENAIKMLDSNIQDAYRLLAAKRVKQIINLRTPFNHLYKRHLYIAKELSRKLKINNVTVVPADKRRTVFAVDNNT
jgi:ribosomal protein L35